MAIITTSAAQAVPATAARGGIVQRIGDAVRRLQERSRISGELMQMSTRELADLGLSPSDIPDVARGTYRRD